MLPKLTKQAGFITQSQFTEGEKKTWIKHESSTALLLLHTQKEHLKPLSPIHRHRHLIIQLHISITLDVFISKYT